MKRILVLLMVLSLVSVGVFGFGGSVGVGEQAIVFTLLPDTLKFGPIVAGETGDSSSPITFSVDSANVDVTLEVTEVEGDTVLDDIKVKDSSADDLLESWEIIEGKLDVVECEAVDSICTHPETLSWDARLTVPSGMVPGVQTATITYTINGVAPA